MSPGPPGLIARTHVVGRFEDAPHRFVLVPRDPAVLVAVDLREALFDGAVGGFR